MGHTLGLRLLQRRDDFVTSFVRAHRVHGNVDLDGPRAGPVRDSADEPGESDAGEHQDSPSATASRGSRRAGVNATMRGLMAKHATAVAAAVLLVAAVAASAQAPCTDRDAYAHPGAWVPRGAEAFAAPPADAAT